MRKTSLTLESLSANLKNTWGSGFGVRYNNLSVHVISVYVPSTVLRNKV